MGILKDETGQRYGRLVVKEKRHRDDRRSWHWLCKCDCGNFCVVCGDNLRNGHTRSCGCLFKENVKTINRTHGASHTSLYTVWRKIKERCSNPKEKGYKDYGGRGIEICKEWLDFAVFSEWAYSNGYEEGLTIDRIDNNGNYCPENCRWVSYTVNNRNRRNTLFLYFDGEIKALIEWAEILKIPYSTLEARLRVCKWSIKKAFETPYIPRPRKKYEES